MAVSRQRSAVRLPKSCFVDKNPIKFEGYTLARPWFEFPLGEPFSLRYNLRQKNFDVLWRVL
jgi:hypothetical protein